MKAVKPSTVQSPARQYFPSWPTYGVQTARASFAAFSKWKGKVAYLYRQEHLLPLFFGSNSRKPRVSTSQSGSGLRTRPWPVKDNNSNPMYVHTYSGVRTQSTEQRRCRMRGSTKSPKKTIDLAGRVSTPLLSHLQIHEITIH